MLLFDTPSEKLSKPSQSGGGSVTTVWKQSASLLRTATAVQKTRLKWSCIFIMWHISQLAHSASNDTEQKASDAQIRALLLNSTSRKQKLHPPPADERHLNFKAMRGRRKFTNVCIQIMLKREKWALPDSFYIHRPLLEWMHFANKHIFSACSSPPQHSSQGKWK